MQEKTLIDKLKQADQQAFRYLVEQYQDKVFNTCVGFVRNFTDAEDLTQEVFVKVYQTMASFREEASISTFVYRIAVNECLAFLRKQKRQKRLGAWLSWLKGDDTETMVQQVPDFVHPGVILENQERAALLLAKMQELPERQRVAFTLHKLEGMSHQEIAAIMQISVSAVESLMTRAKQQLQQKLQAYYSLFIES